MFEDYVGPPDDEIDFVGRFESLADDLVRALRFAGEVFDERAIRETAPVNVSVGLAPCSLELEAMVRENEYRAISRFGYG